MPNIRIDQLPNTPLPLAGDEVAPVVQSGITSKVTINDILGLSSAATTAFEPSGSITATNVQEAVEELDADVALKAPIASPTFTGPVTLNEITGNFASSPLRIRGNFGSTTDVQLSPPYPDGRATELNLAGVPRSNNGLKLIMSDTGAYLWAYYDQFLGVPIPLSLIAGYNASVKLELDPSTGASLYTGTTEKLNIAQDATGTYTFNGTAPRIRGDFSNATVSNRLMFQSSTVNGSTVVGAIPNGTGIASGFRVYNAVDADNASYGQMSINSTAVSITSGKTGTGASIPLNLVANGVETLRLDLSGNSIHVNPAGGLGYGDGAGGSVAQTTSVNTAVTLDKPCGRIDLFNDAVPIGASRQFILNNNLIAFGDGVKIDLVDAVHGDTGDNWIVNTRIAQRLCVITLWNMGGNPAASDFSLYFKLMKGPS